MEPGWHCIRDFMDVLSREGRRDMMYRGQPDSDYDLVPSIYRPGAVGIKGMDDLLAWKRQASRFATPLPQDDVEWLVFAQHYGIATSLLDWSSSPLVALYFACEDHQQHPHADGAVWAVSQHDFEFAHYTLMINPFNHERAKSFLINAVGRNTRSTAQDSLLTLHTPNNYPPADARTIFTVPAQAKRATLLQLEKLGLTGERLKMDITELVWKFKESLKG